MKFEYYLLTTAPAIGSATLTNLCSFRTLGSMEADSHQRDCLLKPPVYLIDTAHRGSNGWLHQDTSRLRSPEHLADLGR